VTASDEYLIITNLKGAIEIWNINSKVRQILLEVKTDFNAIAVSHTPGYIYYHKETGEVT
jgi:hypothetical protein